MTVHPHVDRLEGTHLWAGEQLSAQTRKVFRAALAVDEATWGRGRGWALSIGLIALPYYEHTNPVSAATAHQMIAEVLADHEADHEHAP